MSSESPFDLGGRVAVVTGGNGGIGRSIALGLARAGAAVAILARNEDKNSRVLAELKSVGVPALAVRVDVTQRSTLEQAMSQVERELGGLDILVNNAGVALVSGGVLNESPEDLGHHTGNAPHGHFFAIQAGCDIHGETPRRQDH